jgi:hypothetical protein
MCLKEAGPLLSNGTLGGWPPGFEVPGG